MSPSVGTAECHTGIRQERLREAPTQRRSSPFNLPELLFQDAIDPFGSLCRLRSPPNAFIQVGAEGLSLEESPAPRWRCSRTAWVKRSFRGTPRSAAAALAFRKRTSGISTVVFIAPFSRKYGVDGSASAYSEYRNFG